jgi:NAD(P)H-hydrate repair Nnr-like enzyme with NAD(P)H-hydrate dehydratase domain
MEATSRIIRKALDANIPLVLDADALYLLSLPEYQDLLQKKTAGGDYPQSLVVLTPNVMERKRLAGMEDRWDPTRVVVVEKGHEDSIRSNIDGAETNLVCNEIGGLKR